MKEKTKKWIAAVLTGTVLTSGVVFAKQATESIDVIYDNIKILIDGKEYQPTDVNGNAVEPFIYNGTTYLPVRAIANAFDKEVDWEPQTSTVTLGSKNYDWLDQMGYADYNTTGTRNTVAAIAAKTEMTDGMKYDRGLQFFLCDGSKGTVEQNDGTLESGQDVSYLLNGSYKSFEGVISEKGNAKETALIKFYGDGSLLYTSPIISEGMKSTPFTVNVEGIKLLKITVEVINPDSTYNTAWVYPCIADARLLKK